MFNCNCCLGDACTLKDHLTPCCDWDYGGWVSVGYHSDNARLSGNFDDLLAFNDLPDQLNVHQAWVYVEKAANPTCCNLDWGFRADVMYGTDAQKTQAFGNPRAGTRNQGTWDASLDHGYYGWAVPQLYMEIAKGDWSVIAGHFYTLVGYEVVTAPDNFFYSHAITMFNSEPFTHTGVLSTYSGIDNIEVYNGWTMGWDTGFDQNFDGSNYIGGFSASLTDDVTFTYITTAGNFGFRSAGTDGYSHSVLLDVALSENLNYVLQSDYYISKNGFLGTVGTKGEDVGINQYLFYTLNDCLSVGGRFEWWKSTAVSGTGEHTSVYELTGGINYKPHANVTIRPEIRYDWSPTNLVTAGPSMEDYDGSSVGIDAIFTF